MLGQHGSATFEQTLPTSCENLGAAVTGFAGRSSLTLGGPENGGKPLLRQPPPHHPRRPTIILVVLYRQLQVSPVPRTQPQVKPKHTHRCICFSLPPRARDSKTNARPTTGRAPGDCLHFAPPPTFHLRRCLHGRPVAEGEPLACGEASVAVTCVPVGHSPPHGTG